MRAQGLLLGNYVLFLTLTLALTSLQCSLWFQVFGGFPAPQAWVPALVYWYLYRDLKESIVMGYLVTIVASTLTALPFGLFLLINMCLLIGVVSFKRRIFWPGSTFFALVCGGCTLLFPILHFLTSWIFEKVPITDVRVFEWILGSLITMLSSFPLYRLFSLIDRISQKQLPREAGASEA